MRKFEYKFVSFGYDLENKFNEMGKSGWEFCGVGDIDPNKHIDTYIFKRELK